MKMKGQREKGESLTCRLNRPTQHATHHQQLPFITAVGIAGAATGRIEVRTAYIASF